MREHGKYQIQIMKTRSSSGVGQKVELEFDVDSLRIRDLAEDGEYQAFKKQSSSIYDKLKTSSVVKPNADAVVANEPGKISATVDSSRLKQMLSNIKKQ